MKLIYFIPFLIIGCNHPESKEYDRDQSSSILLIDKDERTYPEYRVIGVKDGDTFEVLKDNSTLVVRFAHIDCPEKSQPFGKRAKQFVSEQCYGKYVTLKHNNKYDRNKRLIAEVILEDGTNLNKLLVKNGLAWHYKKYSKDIEYAELEKMARKNKIGLWSDPNAINPEKWRKK